MYKQSLFVIATLVALGSSSFANEKIEDVVITAKSNKSISDLTSGIKVITSEDITRLNATNVRDVLVKTAGISISPAGTQFGRQGVSIRGSKSDHVLILIDGKKVSGSDTNITNSDYQYSWVPMHSIERIEVIKGAMSSIYGSEAIGGVINIITKEPSEVLHGDIDIKLGSSSDDGGSSKEYALGVSGQIIDDLLISLSAEKKDIDVSTKNGDTYIEGKDYINGMLKAKYNIDDSQFISASYILGKEDRIHANDVKYYEIDRRSYDLSYEKKFEDLSMKFDYYSVESDNYAVSRKSEHQLKNDTLKAEIDIESIENNYIAMGAEFKKEKYDHVYDSPSTRPNFSDKQTTKSYFVQDEIDLGESFILTLGTRYDNHEVFGSELSPKAGLVYKLNDNHRLKVSYGEGFKAPGLKENSKEYNLVLVYPFGSFNFFGNPYLKPETSKNYELAYEYYSNSLITKLSVFKNDIKNLIEFGKIANTSDYTYRNIANADIKGLELELDYSFNDNNLIFNYTYLDAKDKNTNKKLNFRAKNSANLILNSDLSYGITSTLSVKYTGEQFDDSEKLNSYTTTNLQLSKKFAKDFIFRVGVDNIGNEKLDSENSSTPGRVIYAGLNYKF